MVPTEADCPAPGSPHFAITIDNGSDTTELGVETDFTITATSMMGFAGTVALTATATDGSGGAISDWQLPFDSASLTLTSGGTATAHVAITAMGDTEALAGTVAIVGTSGSVTSSQNITVSFQPQLHVEFDNSGAMCSYPEAHGVNSPWMLKLGRSLAVYNMATNSDNLIVHADPNSNLIGIAHEGNAGTAPNAAYIQTPTKVSTTPGGFWCHDISPASPTFLTDPGATNYNYITVVQ